jgi:mono/diheme cytochrome c family protein
MIPPRMNRPFRLLIIACSLVAMAGFVAACGPQKIKVSPSNSTLHQGAVLFSQRCAGCHTFSYAGTRGSASNIRDAEWTNGPNFDQRCERPITRVLYAIANGGFSGLIMPQNVVVGQQARDVAEFVATYSGHQQAHAPGVPSCQQQPIGQLPSPPSTTTSASSGSTSTSATTTTAAASSTNSQTAAATGSPTGKRAKGKGKSTKKAKRAKKK